MCYSEHHRASCKSCWDWARYHQDKPSNSLKTRIPRRTCHRASPDEQVTAKRPPRTGSVQAVLKHLHQPGQQNLLGYNKVYTFLVILLSTFNVETLKTTKILSTFPEQKTLNYCLEEKKKLAVNICITRKRYFFTISYLCYSTMVIKFLKIFQYSQYQATLSLYTEMKCLCDLRK